MSPPATAARPADAGGIRGAGQRLRIPAEQVRGETAVDEVSLLPTGGLAGEVGRRAARGDRSRRRGQIAAVVHALCLRDSHPLPEWVLTARSPAAVALVPAVDLASPYGQRLRQNAPGVCRFHRVYFSAVDLRST